MIRPTCNKGLKWEQHPKSKLSKECKNDAETGLLGLPRCPKDPHFYLRKKQKSKFKTQLSTLKITTPNWM